MVWTIVLEDENKGEISVVEQDLDLPLDALVDLKVLKYLDPYGDTTFNRNQMDDLSSDLESLSKRLELGDESTINIIISLAEDCKRTPHTYITFYGD